MAKLFPELVFVRGPQKGQRVPLSKTMNVVGRDRGCEVEIQDEYASRQHARLIVEGGRVRIVNTSPNGTRVNGKQIEQAALSPGDLISFGLECDARLEPADAAAPGKGPAPSGRPDAAKGADADAQPEQPEQEGKKRRLKKPPAIVWVGIYMLVIAILFITLPKLLRSDKKPTGTGLEKLTRQQLGEMLDEPLNEEINPRLAKQELANGEKAYEAWQTRTVGSSHLYNTFQHFKKALAHSGPNADQLKMEMYHPPGPADKVKPKMIQELMGEIREELLDQIASTYTYAYIEQRQGHWADAQRAYHEVLAMIGNERDPICVHIRNQLNFVKTQILMDKERGGPKKW